MAWTKEEEELIWRTEQAMLPEEERDCVVCRGERIIKLYDPRRYEAIHKLACLECRGTGLLIEQQGVVLRVGYNDDTFICPMCPKCGNVMMLRRNRADSESFWGCVSYPHCRGTRSIAVVGKRIEV